MPDGLIKTMLLTADPYTFPTPASVTYALTSARTSFYRITITDQAASNWWVGLDFMPKLASLTVDASQRSVDKTVVFPQAGLLTMLPNLTSLDISGDFSVPNSTAFTGVATLSWFNAQAPSFQSMRAVFPDLESFAASMNVPSFEGLSGFPKLKSINVWGLSPTFSAVGLTNLPELDSLKLDFNGLTTFPALSGLPKLTTVSLIGNALTAIPDFSGVQSLTMLNLNMNNLSSASWPQNMPHLKQLSLGSNHFASLRDVSVDGTVDMLDLTNNDKFTNLAGLDRFGSVAQLNIGNTWNSPMTDFSDVLSYKNIPTKVTVDPGWYTIPDNVPLNVSQRVSDYISLPAGVVPTVTSQMNTTVGKDPGTFIVTTNARFKFYWQLPAIGNISFSQATMDGTGDASLPGINVTVSGPADPVAAGGAMHFQGTVGGPDASKVTSYQWLASSSNPVVIGSADLVQGGTSSTLSVINTKQTGPKFYALAAYVGNVPILSNTVDSNALVGFPDAELAKCVTQFHGGPLTYTNLAKDTQQTSYDCSARGVTSIEGLQYVHGVSLGIGGGRAAQFSLSHNQISDITPLASTLPDPFHGIDVDLSYNAISDASPLWTITGGSWSGKNLDNPRTPGGFILDHNHVTDLSGLSTLPSPPGLGNNPAAVSFLNQDVTLPNATVGVPVTLPQVTGPDGKAVTFSSPDGTIGANGTITFTSVGKKTISWQKVQAQYARFSGSFSVTVVSSPDLVSLAVSPATPKAGNLMTFTGKGFIPGEKVTFTWNDGQGSSQLGQPTADAAGGVQFSWRVTDPSQHGQVTVNAVGNDSGTQANLAFTLATDDTVAIPDAALRACFTDALGLPRGSILYRSVTNGMAGTLDCRARGITDLTGLDAFKAKNGAILLGGNALTSLTTLPSMAPGLWQIDLSDNGIVTTGPVAAQDLMLQIVVSGNRISDFTDLQKSGSHYIIGIGQRIDVPNVVLTGQTLAKPQVTVQDRVDTYGTSPVTVSYLPLPQGASEPQPGVLRFDTAGTYEIGFLVTYFSKDTSVPWASGVFVVTVADPHGKVLNINPTTLYAGQMLNATAAGFTPGETVIFTLNSTSLFLGNAVATDRGTARITNAVIPLGTSPGTHEVVATGVTSGVTVTTTLTITPPPGGPAPGGPVSNLIPLTGGAPTGQAGGPSPASGRQGTGWGLPKTGGGDIGSTLPAALVLVLALVAMVKGRRKP